MSRKANNKRRMKTSKRQGQEKPANEGISQEKIRSGQGQATSTTLDRLTTSIRNNRRIQEIHEDNLSRVPLINKLGPNQCIAFLSVLREYVEQCNPACLFNDLCEKLYDKETVIRRRQDVRLVFYGYNDDSRPLCVIPEVQSFILKIDEMFPYMFYFAAIDEWDGGFLPLLFHIACCEMNGNGDYIISPDKADRFFVKHFHHMNEIFAKYELDEDLKRRMSREINENIGQYMQLEG